MWGVAQLLTTLSSSLAETDSKSELNEALKKLESSWPAERLKSMHSR